MLKVGIIGGTGYTGIELLRILAQHSGTQVEVITSRSEAGKKVSGLFPNLTNYLDLEFSAPEINKFKTCDVVFSSTPNGVAMQYAKDLLDADVRLIDLAADFRFKDVAIWSKWYGMEHVCPELVADAVYGLPEANRDLIKNAKLIGNPGCYPTSVQLGLLPLIENDLIDTKGIIADCKSGVSGAGRRANLGILQAESAENFKAYAMAGHRHQPEIEHNLELFTGSSPEVTFTPHLIPMIRGIHSTIYANLKTMDADLQKMFVDRYQNEHFVEVLEHGSMPETKWVKGSNKCMLAVHQKKDKAIILSVIDNLVKGASGQAVQNMNIMFGLPESTGINHISLMP